MIQLILAFFLLDFFILFCFILAFPNVFSALRIYLTMTTSVALGEKNVLKLTLIKTYLRFTISQKRLHNLPMLSLENEIAKSIDFEYILQIKN